MVCRFIYLFLFITLVTACSHSQLEHALRSAGDNRAELEKILAHYKDDELKLKAAKFLITNMPYHFSRREYLQTLSGEKYRPDISLFNSEEEVKNYVDSLVQHGYRTIQNRLPDINNINSEYLINNIDLAFTAWQKPWAKDVPFIDFCRYILPYRAQAEQPSHLRKEIMERFMPILEAANAVSPLEACMVLNEYLRENAIIRYRNTGLPFYPTIDETYKSGVSQCEGICNLGTFIMRAVGIPVAVDMTIWTKMDLGHSWCAVLNNGMFYSFGPGEDQPLEHAKKYAEIRVRRPAKVYRTRFDPVDFSRLKNDDGFVTAMKSPLIQDVTNEYLTPTTNIRIIVDETDFNHQSNQVYLRVHNFYEWKIIAVGERSESVCIFQNVVGDNIFIVSDSPDGRTLRHITAPFYVSKNGEIHKFIPQLNNREALTITKGPRRRGMPHTLFYWDIYEHGFLPVPYISKTDSTQSFDQVPKNALLWFAVLDRSFNQRVFFVENDTIMRY
jgi:hypothetical protein